MITNVFRKALYQWWLVGKPYRVKQTKYKQIDTLGYKNLLSVQLQSGL